MAVQYCNYDIKGTLAVSGTSTFTGAATFGSSINMSDNQPINFGGQTMFTHTGSITRIGDNSSSSVLSISSGTATFTGSIITSSTSAVIQTPRISMEADGTLDWGQAKDYGTLTWSGGYAFLKGQVNKGIKIQVNNSTTALTIDTSADATFAQEVTATGGFLVPYQGATKKPMINLVSATNYGLWHTEASNDIFSFDFAGVSKHQFIENGNATHAGDLTVTGGGISLGSVGRIQGVDTVSATTDAANKAYVDSAVSGAGSGTFLPLAGGTMTGDIQFNEHSAKFNQSGVRSWDVSASSGNLNITSGDSGGLVFLSPGISVEDNAFIGGYANVTGNITVGSTSATSEKRITVLAGDGNTAGFQAYGSSQGTGFTYVGQSATYGGGMFYNGDGSPSFATGEVTDTISFYRRDNGTNTVAFYYAYQDSKVIFKTDIEILGGDIILAGTGRIQGVDTVSASTDAANKAYVDAHVSPAGTYLPLTGGTMSGNIGMGDNDIDGIDELKFSSGTKLGDDGSTSYVRLTYADSNDGGIKVQDVNDQVQGYLYGSGGVTSQFGLLTGAGEWAVRTVENGPVELRHDNSVKFITTSTGISVTGNGNFSGDVVVREGVSGQITISTNTIQSNQHLILGSNGGANIEMYTNGQAYYDAVSHSFRDSDASPTYFSITASQVNSFVKLSVASNKIIDLATPTLSTDAANKAYVDAQVATIPSGLNFQGNWNASTNSPTLTSGSGTPGFYYNVSVPGSTNLDGETDWQVGDWAVFVENGANDFWEKIDNTSALTGVGVSGRVTFWDGTNTLSSDSGLTYDSSANNLTVGTNVTAGNNIVAGGTVQASQGYSYQWAEAYNNQVTAISDSGSSTITLTLTQQDGGTLTTSFSNPQGTVTGTGANNRIALWNGTTAIDSDSDFYVDGDTIFTTNLEANGNISVADDINITNAGGIISFTGAGYIGAADNFYVGGASNGTDHTFIGDNGRNVTIYNGATLTVSGALTLSTVAAKSTAGSIFLTMDGSVVKYRSAAQVLSDIGGAPATGGAYLPLAGGTMTTTAKIKFYNANQYIHANSSNDLTIASGDDINYLSNFNRFYTSGLEFARLSGSNDSWIANGTNSKLGVNKSSGINYNLDVEGTFGTTGAITIGGNATFNGAQVTFNPDADSSLRILNAGTDAIAIFAAVGDVLYLGGNNTTGMYLDQSANAVFSGNLYIPEYIYHSGDNNTYIRFTADTQTFRTGGDDRLTLTNTLATLSEPLLIDGVSNYSGLEIKGTGASRPSVNLSNVTTGILGQVYATENSALVFATTASGTTALTIDSSQNATFAGGIKVNGPGSFNTIKSTNDYTLGLVDSNNVTQWWLKAYTDGSFALHENGVGDKFTIAAGGNATFAGDLTVSGGDITLGGTGRIQGVDTVSAGTDAANKDYVDTAVAGSGSGTVTSVSSATTSQLTVSQSSPAPALSIVTAAVANGGTGLATGNQIYDWGVAAFAPIVSGGYLPLAGGTMTGNVRLNDNVQLQLGSSNDAYIMHNGTHTYFVNGVGNLEITNDTNDGDILFKCDNGSGGLTEYFRLDGGAAISVVSRDFKFSDNVKARFGTSDDLKIYHDGSNSYIQETGTGELIISSGTVLRLRSDASPTGEEYINCTRDGAVALFHNNVEKFHTSVTGVDVLGDLTVDTSAVIDGATTINGQLNQNGDIKLGASASIVLDDTPTGQTTSGSGTIVEWSVSTSVSAGLLYVVKSDGGWTTADADSEAKSTAMAAIALGGNATSGMLLQGFFYKSNHGFAIGAPLYISNTAGAFSNSRPTGTGDYVRIIGYATSTNFIYFDPDKTWVKID